MARDRAVRFSLLLFVLSISISACSRADLERSARTPEAAPVASRACVAEILDQDEPTSPSDHRRDVDPPRDHLDYPGDAELREEQPTDEATGPTPEPEVHIAHLSMPTPPTYQPWWESAGRSWDLSIWELAEPTVRIRDEVSLVLGEEAADESASYSLRDIEVRVYARDDYACSFRASFRVDDLTGSGGQAPGPDVEIGSSDELRLFASAPGTKEVLVNASLESWEMLPAQDTHPGCRASVEEFLGQDRSFEIELTIATAHISAYIPSLIVASGSYHSSPECEPNDAGEFLITRGARISLAWSMQGDEVDALRFDLADAENWRPGFDAIPMTIQTVGHDLQWLSERDGPFARLGFRDGFGFTAHSVENGEEVKISPPVGDPTMLHIVPADDLTSVSLGVNVKYESAVLNQQDPVHTSGLQELHVRVVDMRRGQEVVCGGGVPFELESRTPLTCSVNSDRLERSHFVRALSSGRCVLVASGFPGGLEPITRVIQIAR